MHLVNRDLPLVPVLIPVPLMISRFRSLNRRVRVDYSVSAGVIGNVCTRYATAIFVHWKWFCR